MKDEHRVDSVKDSIQIAQQKIRSQRQNFAWETLGEEEALKDVDEIRENIKAYYAIKNR